MHIPFKSLSIYLISLSLCGLAGCGPFETREQVEQRLEAKYMQLYTIYDCPQLHQKYREVKNRLSTETQMRTTRNTVNMTVGAIRELDRQSIGRDNFGYSRPYNTGYEHESRSEIDYIVQARVIEHLALAKQCQGVSFF